MSIGVAFWYVASQGRSGPVGDLWWDSVYIAVKTATGTLTAKDFLVMSWGHRAAVTRLITAISTLATGYDAGLLRFLTFALTVGNLGLALLLICARGPTALAAFGVSSTLLFTLYYPPNWIDMAYSAWQQALLFTLIGLLVVQRMRVGWISVLLLMVCATAATFSHAAGLAAWISLPVAAAGVTAYRRWLYAGLWIALFALILGFYASGYAVPAADAQNGFSISNSLGDGIVRFALYPIRFQGLRFNADGRLEHLAAIAIAALGVGVFAANWQRMRALGEGQAAALWSALALYSLGAALLVLFARGPAPLSRYSPGADGFWLAVIALSL